MMTDEQVKQRVQYLIEHGGLYDDPLADIRRKIRVLYWLVGTALLFHALEALHLL